MGFWSKIGAAFGGGTAEDVFVAEVQAMAAEQGIRTQRKPGELALSCTMPGDGGAEENTINLHNVFAETREVSAEERRARIRSILSLVTDRPEAPLVWAAARGMLAPTLRGGSALAFSFKDGTGPGAMVVRPFVPFLYEAVAIDTPNAMAYLRRDQLAPWQVDEADVFAAARGNLAPAAERGVKRYDEGLWTVASNDSYESSRLLLPAWLASFRGRVHGEPICAVPHRSQLFVCGDGDVEAVTRLAGMAEREFAASPRGISPAVYALGEGDRVVPFCPPGHPAFATLRRGHLLLAAFEYGYQKGELERRHEEDGTDVFVASLTIIERQGDGKPLGYVTWVEGVSEGLLPFADVVVLCEGAPPDARYAHVPWAAVAELAGDFWALDRSVTPARMRTHGFPAGAVLEQLRARSVDLATLPLEAFVTPPA